MCMVSAIGDQYSERWRDRYPTVVQPPTYNIFSGVTREEFEALKAEVERLKVLLMAAKKYDEENGEPDCEMDEKVALLKRIADLVGVDLTEVFG